VLGLTQHIRRLGLKALGLLTLQHVQQGLQAAQAQRGVREPRLFDQLKHPAQADADDLHTHTHTRCELMNTVTQALSLARGAAGMRLHKCG